MLKGDLLHMAFGLNRLLRGLVREFFGEPGEDAGVEGAEEGGVGEEEVVEAVGDLEAGDAGAEL